MNKKIGMIGSVVAGISILIFAIAMIVPCNFLSYFVCIFLSLGYVLMSCGFYSNCSDKKKVAGLAGVAFASIYAVLILLVYFAQTSSVRLDNLNEQATKILDFQKSGLMFNYDLLGYGIMALSTFFVGLTLDYKKQKVLKLMLMVHGIFFPACLLMPMLGIFSNPSESSALSGVIALEIWNAYFLPITILSFKYFRKIEK